MNGETPTHKPLPKMATVGISQNCVSLFPSLMLTRDLCFWSLGEIGERQVPPGGVGGSLALLGPIIASVFQL